MNCSDVYTVCYNRLAVFKTKDRAKQFFSACYNMSKGEEQERYASVVNNLNLDKLSKDNLSTYCKTISINTDKNGFINVDLNENLSIEDTIKFYENKIKPILEVSEEFDVDFSSKIPFEYFGSDSDSYTNNSFSDFYKKLCEKSDISIESISTNNWSDGKYKLLINNNEFDIKAWDNLESVINNINSMKDLLKEQKEEIEI